MGRHVNQRTQQRQIKTPVEGFEALIRRLTANVLLQLQTEDGQSYITNARCYVAQLDLLGHQVSAIVPVKQLGPTLYCYNVTLQRQFHFHPASVYGVPSLSVI